MENRKRLALTTTRYFAQMPSAVANEENDPARDMASSGAAIDFDWELCPSETKYSTCEWLK